MSPLIFALIIDWLMKTVFAWSTEGIAWSNGSALGDLEFADDTTLLSGSWEGMKILTARLEAEASKVGLRVNVAKTTIMRMAALTSTDSVEVESLPIEELEQFCYLETLSPTMDRVTQRFGSGWEKPTPHLENYRTYGGTKSSRSPSKYASIMPSSCQHCFMVLKPSPWPSPT